MPRAAGVLAGGAMEGREARVAGVAEDPSRVDVRRVAVVAAGFASGFLPTGGVFVLDVDELDRPLLLAGFVGDRMPPIVRAPGVGLPTMALALLPGPSTTLCRFTPFTAVCTLLGRGLNPLLAGLGAGFGVGSSRTSRTPDGRRNMPYPAWQSK